MKNIEVSWNLNGHVTPCYRSNVSVNVQLYRKVGRHEPLLPSLAQRHQYCVTFSRNLHPGLDRHDIDLTRERSAGSYCEDLYRKDNCGL